MKKNIPVEFCGKKTKQQPQKHVGEFVLADVNGGEHLRLI